MSAEDTAEDAAASSDDDQSVDEDQLEEYNEMLEQLGAYPDKMIINSLSMVAEDFAESAKGAAGIYQCIRALLLSASVTAERKLPLVYVVDSILKNVRGRFIPLIESDAAEWISAVHGHISDEQRAKLRKVLDTWRQGAIFSETSLTEMGRCFADSDKQAAAKRASAENVTGIGRNAGGSLELAPALRKQMQLLLDEVQSEGVDELDKVSLERLAEINPNLLADIKNAAEGILSEGGGEGSSGGDQVGAAPMGVGTVGTRGGGRSAASTPIIIPPSMPSSFLESRTEEVVARAADWAKLDLDHLEKAHVIISKLQHHVRSSAVASQGGASAHEIETQVGLLVSASATARQLTEMLEALKAQEEKADGNANATNVVMAAPRFAAVAIDRSLFTNDGIKKKNDGVIARLYDGGLPFVSASDGRRFATQGELSEHLDGLFRKGQIEKTMERTEERGWYTWEGLWTGRDKASHVEGGDGKENEDGPDAEANSNPDEATVPADESRDRCLICGINFAMFFDQDEGDWRYKNCREVNVLNDDAAEKESEDILVHLTCLRGLGNPEVLTMDQVLQIN